MHKFYFIGTFIISLNTSVSFVAFIKHWWIGVEGKSKDLIQNNHLSYLLLYKDITSSQNANLYFQFLECSGVAYVSL